MKSPPTSTVASPDNNTTYSMSTMDIVYVTVTVVSSSLSVIGCLIIIGAHVAYRMLRTTGRAMLVQLSIADMLTALGNLLGVLWYLFRDTGALHRNMGYCWMQSAWTIFSSIASFFWTVVIGLAMCWSIVLGNRSSAVDRYWNILFVICWGVPAMVMVTALSCGVLGYDAKLNQASWCWIDPEATHPLFWTFFTGKAWELTASLLTIFLYSVIKISLIRHKARTKTVVGGRIGHLDAIQEANVKLTFVPLVFIVLRIWGTVRFLLGFTDHGYASSTAAAWIVPLQGIGDSAQGFANFVMYCFFTKNVRMRLFRCCRSNQVESGSVAVADNPTSAPPDHRRSRLPPLRARQTIDESTEMPCRDSQSNAPNE